jgi:putative acetyltransferase
MELKVAKATNADCPGIIAVIKDVCVEYGFTWEDGGYFGDLFDVEGYYLRKGGMFWTVREGDETVGTCGVKHWSAEMCELSRMYLLKKMRGQGLGGRLFQLATDWSREQGYRRMEIWSDVKLTDAHAMYQKRGAIPIGQRICDDPDDSLEYGFLYELASVSGG